MPHTAPLDLSRDRNDGRADRRAAPAPLLTRVRGVHGKIRGQNTDNRRTACAAGDWFPRPRVMRKRLVDTTNCVSAEEGSRTPKPLRAGDFESPASASSATPARVEVQ